jgi:hypothetical protein
VERTGCVLEQDVEEASFEASKKSYGRFDKITHSGVPRFIFSTNTTVMK